MGSAEATVVSLESLGIRISAPVRAVAVDSHKMASLGIRV